MSEPALLSADHRWVAYHRSSSTEVERWGGKYHFCISLVTILWNDSQEELRLKKNAASLSKGNLYLSGCGLKFLLVCVWKNKSLKLQSEFLASEVLFKWSIYFQTKQSYIYSVAGNIRHQQLIIGDA